MKKLCIYVLVIIRAIEWKWSAIRRVSGKWLMVLIKTLNKTLLYKLSF